MERVFISQSFKEPDRDLIATVVALVEAAGMTVSTGDALATGPVSQGVQALISASDACVAIATPAEKTKKRQTGKGTKTHSWVKDEIVIAKALKKPCIAVVARGVRLDGAYSEEEKIDYDPERPLPALTKLARILGKWRREAGRPVRVVPLPPGVAQVLGNNATTALCQYRLWNGRGQSTPWRPASVVPAQGAPVVHLERTSDDSLIEIQVEIGKKRWCSKAVQPFTHVTFEEVAS